MATVAPHPLKESPLDIFWKPKPPSATEKSCSSGNTKNKDWPAYVLKTSTWYVLFQSIYQQNSENIKTGLLVYRILYGLTLVYATHLLEDSFQTPVYILWNESFETKQFFFHLKVHHQKGCLTDWQHNLHSKQNKSHTQKHGWPKQWHHHHHHQNIK